MQDGDQVSEGVRDFCDTPEGKSLESCACYAKAKLALDVYDREVAKYEAKLEEWASLKGVLSEELRRAEIAVSLRAAEEGKHPDQYAHINPGRVLTGPCAMSVSDRRICQRDGYLTLRPRQPKIDLGESNCCFNIIRAGQDSEAEFSNIKQSCDQHIGSMALEEAKEADLDPAVYESLATATGKSSSTDSSSSSTSESMSWFTGTMGIALAVFGLILIILAIVLASAGKKKSGEAAPVPGPQGS